MKINVITYVRTSEASHVHTTYLVLKSSHASSIHSHSNAIVPGRECYGAKVPLTDSISAFDMMLTSC